MSPAEIFISPILFGMTVKNMRRVFRLLYLAILAPLIFNLLGCAPLFGTTSVPAAAPARHSLSWGKPVTKPKAAELSIYWLPQFEDETDAGTNSITIRTMVKLNKNADQNGKTGTIELWKKSPAGDLKLAARTYYLSKGDKIDYQEFVVACSTKASEFYAVEPIDEIKSAVDKIACKHLE